jgi:hypothetical protein
MHGLVLTTHCRTPFHKYTLATNMLEVAQSF